MRKHGAPEEITGLTVNCYGSRNLYLTCMYRLEDTDGAVLFSCRCYAAGESGAAKEIELERVPVAPAYMQQLLEFVKEHDYLNAEDDDPAKRGFLVRDALECSMTFRWADYDDLTIHSMLSLPPGGDELKSFFMGLAEKCAKK